MKALLCVLCTWSLPLWAVDTGTRHEQIEQHLFFDIPAQPLIDALDKYAMISGQPALFRTDLVTGRMSSALRGHHAPGDALRRLTEGSGLQVEEISSEDLRVYVLKQTGQTDVTANVRTQPDNALAQYESLVQSSVLAALCRDPRTAPGRYRALLRFGVDAEGKVRQPRLLGSTKERERDAALLSMLEQVYLGSPPPMGLQQPLTLIIVPGAAGAQPVCHQGSASDG